MRIGFALLTFMSLSLLHANAQDQDATPPRRYGVILNTRGYPQADYKQALASVLKAIEKQRYDYVLAHLTDPNFVNKRVKEVYDGNFDELVKETATKFNDNPADVKTLERFVKEAEWDAKDDSAVARVKDVKDRQVFMKKIGKSWYLENKVKAEK